MTENIMKTSVLPKDSSPSKITIIYHIINTSDKMRDAPMDKAAVRWKQIEKFLGTHESIMKANVRELCVVSAATANRILNGKHSVYGVSDRELNSGKLKE